MSIREKVRRKAEGADECKPRFIGIHVRAKSMIATGRAQTSGRPMGVKLRLGAAASWAQTSGRSYYGRAWVIRRDSRVPSAKICWLYAKNVQLSEYPVHSRGVPCARPA